MPKDTYEVGDILQGKELGKKYKSRRYILVSCPKCNEKRWISFNPKIVKSVSRMCVHCSSRANMLDCKGNKHPCWKGGRPKTRDGYVSIRLYPDDFFYPMANNKYGYVLEHRLVMAKHLGRCLHRWEIVHHKNHIRDDNSIDNLQLVSDDRHKQIGIMERRIATLEERVTLLEAENIVLKEGVLI